MCGLTGYFAPLDFSNEDELRGAVRTITHRGPDASGIYVHNKVGLGHVRLSIIDLSTASNQPFYSKCGNYVIVFNGEVYNYKELALKYKLDLSASSDTAVIVELYARLGKEFVEELNGMFVFVIYDIRKEELFICRDRLGVKPLYYYSEGPVFCFGSELKTMKAFKGINQKYTLNKRAIGLYLHLGYIPQPHTIYNEIRKFPSGTYAIINDRGTTFYPYWEAHKKITKELHSDYKEAKSTLKNLLESSIQYRMISDVPFGTFLSGGIDSSLVTAIAQRNSNTPVNTFSIGFKEWKFNESEHAKNVAKYLRTEHEEFFLSEKEAMDSFEEIMMNFDEPFADTSALPTYMVSKMAGNKVKMVLTGDGGDELFMGYGSYVWAEKLAQKKYLLTRSMLHAILKNIGGSRNKRVAQLLNFKAGTDIRSHIFSQELYFFSKAELEDILQTEDARIPKDWLPVDRLMRNLSAKEQQAFFDLNYYLKDDLLVKVDRASMYASIEAREPLLDYRIVEYALNLDESFKHKNGIGKFILKDILYDYVPKSFFARPKWGFGIPLNKWLKRDFSFMIDKYLSTDVLLKYNIVDPLKMKAILNRFYNGEDYLFNRIWVVLLLHKWLEEEKL